jgi:hypothetical protein
MFKRLIFAVFVLGLVLTFSGTAISDTGMKEGLNPIATSNPNAPLFGTGIDGRPDQSNYRIPAESFIALSAADAAPTPPSGYFCDEYKYWCDSTGSFWIWNMRANGLDIIANRFVVEGLDVCTLTVQWGYVLTHPNYLLGAGDIDIVVWDDDGFGFPGVERARHTVLAAEFPAGPTWTWVGADFYADEIIYGPGDEYHVGLQTVWNDPGDQIYFPTDQAQPWLDHSGEVRGNFHVDGGAWGTILDMTLDDNQPVIKSEWCGYETPFTDCYSLDYVDNAHWLYMAPHPSYTFSEYAMRFSVNSPETLTAVEVGVFDVTGAPWAPPGYGPGTNNIIVTVYGDNGGYPDDGNILATEIIAAGTYPFYPSLAYVDFSAYNLFFAPGDEFHVSFASDGAVGVDCEVLQGDDGLSSVARGYVRDDGGMAGVPDAWLTMMDMYGENDLFHIISTMCIDPYNDCYSYNYNAGSDYFWYLPDVYGSTAHAQHFEAKGTDCKLGEVSFGLYDTGDPDQYTTDATVTVYLGGGGVPALALGSVPLTPADYVLFPGKTTVDFGPLDIYLVGDFWVAIQSHGTDETDGLRTISDLGGSNQHFGAAELWNGSWGLMANNWVGTPTDLAFDVQAAWCCIPLPTWPCNLPDDAWNTAQWDDARTGHSQAEAGAPNEDLLLNWNYEHPTDQAYFSSPAVYDGKVICGFEIEYRVFDLLTGTPLYSIIPNNTQGNMRGTPLATNLGGTDVVFVASGAGRSVECWNFDAGTFIWEYTHVSGGTNRYSSFQLLNIGGTEVLFFGTDDGNIYALDATTGLEFAGWTTNPVNVGYGVGFSGATDGTQLFYSTYAGGFDCDVVSVRASDGYQRWSLATDWGLRGTTVYPTEAITGEGFQSGVSYDKKAVFANSYPADGAHPADGIFYSLNSDDGAPNWAVASARSLYSTPLVDQKYIYQGFFSRWLSPPIGGNIASFHRAAGAVGWTTSHPNDDNYYNDIAMTCEPDEDADNIVPDLIFAGGHKGFLSCYNSADGEQLFDRQINYGDPFSSMFNGLAIVPGDGVEYNYHVVAAHFYGGLSVQSSSVAKALRPRLEIQSYNPSIACEFGSATSLQIDIPDLLLNTGGAALTINDLTTDESCFDYHPEFSSVRPDVADQAMTIAEQLTSDKFLKANRLQDNFDESFGVRDTRKELSLNAGAMARPAFIQTASDPDGIIFPVDGYMVAPGEYVTVTVDINQSMIQRGAQPFSMYVDTDDPDFYLNQNPMGGDIPCVFVTIVGGCLLDTVSLPFGMGCGNVQIVTNTGRMGTGDWTPHAFDIDGDVDSWYQGSYFYAASQYSIAMNTQNWSGNGEEESYWSMQADPNWYDGGCPPSYVEDVPASCFGGYSTDGETYTPLLGNAVYKTYLDSVQNFDEGSGWSWANYGAAFDNALTMGLWVNSITVGVCDFEPLKNVTVEIIQIHERNGNPVTDWAFGATIDYDVGNDTAFIDRSISTAWSATASGGDVAWGTIKLPFGCGENANTTFEPYWNAGHLDAGQAHFEDLYWDSAYYYTQLPAGLFGHSVVTGMRDQEFHATFVKNDFVGNDTLMFAVVNFGMAGLADAHDASEFASLAHLTNKWVGFGRGDVNNDNLVDLRDLVYLKAYLFQNGPGPVPFMHLGDVNLDDAVDQLDALHLFDWYFNAGDCPQGDWCFFD